MIDLSPALDPNFWFDLTPSYLSPTFERIFFILFATFIIVGALVRIYARSKKKKNKEAFSVRMRVGTMMVSMGLIGFVWFFFTYEGIQLFGARFWFLPWILGLIVWIYMLIRHVKVELPKQREEAKQKSIENKYIPRKKRR